MCHPQLLTLAVVHQFVRVLLMPLAVAVPALVPYRLVAIACALQALPSGEHFLP